MILKSLLAVSVAANVALWSRLSVARWRVESAYREGQREGWFTAARHAQLDRDSGSDHFLN